MKTYTITVGAPSGTVTAGTLAVTTTAGQIALSINDDVLPELNHSDMIASISDLLRAAQDAQRIVENT